MHGATSCRPSAFTERAGSGDFADTRARVLEGRSPRIYLGRRLFQRIAEREQGFLEWRQIILDSSPDDGAVYVLIVVT
jgi:hypothetical protein